MKEEAFQVILDSLLIFFLYLAISLAWQLGEWLLYRKITPKIIDDIVAVVLAVSIFHNLRG